MSNEQRFLLYVDGVQEGCLRRAALCLQVLVVAERVMVTM
jgi:hypothetical protein